MTGRSSLVLDAQVRAWAEGLFPLEAGTELLIRGGFIYDGAPWLVRGTLFPNQGYAVGIDAEALIASSGVWSGGEQRLARIAASLLDGPPVNLFEDVAGLDDSALELVLAAFAHANGYPGAWPKPKPVLELVTPDVRTRSGRGADDE